MVSDGKDKVYQIGGVNEGSNQRKIFGDVHFLDLSEIDEFNLKATASKVCALCGVSEHAEKLKKCSGKCGGAVLYCSPTCQKNDWKNHKPFCKKD